MSFFNTSFGENQFGEGGFVNDFSNSTKTEKKNTVKRAQNIVPVVVRMLKDYPHEDFVFFGLPVQMVTLVGILRNFNVQSTKATCTIEDHTGAIKAIYWLDNGDNVKEGDNVELPSLQDNTYVHVFGSIRHQNGEKMVMILKMIPVDDCNVLLTHLLQVVSTRVMAESAQKIGSLAVARTLIASEMPTSMSAFDEDTPIHTANVPFTPLQDKIFQILHTDNDSSGMHISRILAHFKPTEASRVKADLYAMANEGHVYSTVDSDHYKATNPM